MTSLRNLSNLYFPKLSTNLSPTPPHPTNPQPTHPYKAPLPAPLSLKKFEVYFLKHIFNFKISFFRPYPRPPTPLAPYQPKKLILFFFKKIIKLQILIFSSLPANYPSPNPHYRKNISLFFKKNQLEKLFSTLIKIKNISQKFSQKRNIKIFYTHQSNMTK